jgi:hypothetical protein
MAQEAPINEECIIGMPTCGYAFSSTRMAFIATPADDEFALEVDILKSLLEDKGYEAYIALRNIDPGKFAFCTKICSKIITSQFCVVLLNPSAHRDYADVKIPNPNVHMEYGLMLAFRKYVLPFQRRGEPLSFNIQPLDTLLYNKGDFRKIADQAIDTAILAVGTAARPTRALSSSELLLKYLTVRRLRVTQLNNDEARTLHALGSFPRLLLARRGGGRVLWDARRSTGKRGRISREAPHPKSRPSRKDFRGSYVEDNDARANCPRGSHSVADPHRGTDIR